jgi:hypothetical protein
VRSARPLERTSAEPGCRAGTFEQRAERAAGSERKPGWRA